jgi:hypothetical protein
MANSISTHVDTVKQDKPIFILFEEISVSGTIIITRETLTLGPPCGSRRSFGCAAARAFRTSRAAQPVPRKQEC